MNLRGRSDLPLARLGGAATRIDVVQRQGPLEVIRLDQALVVLEIPPGERHTTLVLPPGKYVVRRRSHGETFAAEVQVDAGRSAEIREESLVLVGTPSLATKGSDSAPPVLATTLPAGTWEVGMEGGVVPLPYSEEAGADLMVLPRVAVGLGDHWQLSLIMPELAYRFGTAGGTELVASVGVAGFGNRNDGNRQVSPQAAIAIHQEVGNGQAVFGSIGSATRLVLGGGSGARSFDEVRLGGALGWSMTLGRHLTLSPSVAFVERNEARAEGGTLFLGAGSSIAGRARPLVRVHLGPSWSVDGNAGFTFSTNSHEWTELYSAGTTWTF